MSPCLYYGINDPSTTELLASNGLVLAFRSIRGGFSRFSIASGQIVFQPRPKQSEHSGFFRFELIHRARDLFSDPPFQDAQQRSIRVRLDDRRMNITLPAYRFGISQFFGNGFDGLNDVAFALRV